ncbi:MAG: DUF1405 domain-containing protein [Candidatus Micrarchaeota archaeon]|nr:DUF1405 domain-containing protein [Candidatus Micrarchaeota archaeon]
MKKELVLVLAIANLIGALYGFIFYYGGQLLSTNPLLAIFVPDCPLHALLMGLALILSLRGFHSDWFYALCAAGAIKYGFWTVFVLSAYSPFYFTPEAAPLYFVLFISHVVLMLEPALLKGAFLAKPVAIIPAAVWLFANDFSDYLLSTHPPLPPQALGFMFIATMAMTTLSLIVVLYAFGRRSSNSRT